MAADEKPSAGACARADLMLAHPTTFPAVMLYLMSGDEVRAIVDIAEVAREVGAAAARAPSLNHPVLKVLRTGWREAPWCSWKKVACGAFFETRHGSRRPEARLSPATQAKT